MLSSSPLAAEEPLNDGWFPVEQLEKTPFEEDDKDSSIWVIFMKNLGDEKILARFPEDPHYQYITPQNLEISSTKGAEMFKLWVQEIPRDRDPFEQRAEEILSLPEVVVTQSDSEGLNFVYQAEGKWFREHLLQTGSHLYLFQTSSYTATSANHEIFIHSFEIENIR